MNTKIIILFSLCMLLFFLSARAAEQLEVQAGEQDFLVAQNIPEDAKKEEAAEWWKNPAQLQEMATIMVVFPLLGWIAQNSFANFYEYKAGSYEPVHSGDFV